MKKERKIYVLDTNIILADVNNIFKVSEEGENLIILPETVIDELDAKKSGFDEINFQAREFSRLLFEGQKEDNAIILDYGNTKVKIVKVLIHNTEIHTIEMEDYGLKGIDRSILNDRKILKVANFVQDTYLDKAKINQVDQAHEYIQSTFLTLDGMCYIRAISAGLNTEALLYDRKDLNPTFIKTIKTRKQIVNGKPIQQYDPDYCPENYCYIFETGKEKVYAYVKDEMINIIEETQFSRMAIKPKNEGQMFAMAAMLDNDLDVVLVDALAGSGKTLLAIATAMRCIDTNQSNSSKKFERIVYIRNSVESTDKGEEVGFLSGNEEKFKIYNLPLYDTVNFLASLTLKNQKKTKGKEKEEAIENKMKYFFERYKIETMWVGSIRGRTIRNAYVIIDEGQNFSKKSMQTVMTRVDENCKLVVIGSNRQIDNQFVNKYTNGLNILLKTVSEKQQTIKTFATSLMKVERGKLTAWAESIFSN